MDVENIAKSMIQRGIDFEKSKRYTESLTCFSEGIQILIDKMKGETDQDVRIHLKGVIENYMSRAEQIKLMITRQKEQGNYHEQVKIDNDSKGHSYESLFGRFLDKDVTYVKIEDPYIRSFHQCQNFLRVCELLVKTCKNLKAIQLTTSNDNSELSNDQNTWFELLKDSLQQHKVMFVYNLSTTLHDRQIILSNGWIIKIGRGLDIYKAPATKFDIGMHELNFRPCYETIVDIYHSSTIKFS